MDSEVESLSAAVCKSANTTLIVTCVAIAFILAVLALLLRLVLAKKHLMSPVGRTLLAAGLAFALGTAVVALSPIRHERFLDCIETPEFSHLILLAQVAPYQRGLILGGGLAVAFYALFVLVGNIIGTARRRA